jgi:diaminopimelate epimerase
VRLPDWDTWDTDRLRALGRKLRCAPVFPRGANVSFVKASGADAVKAVTYERGVEDFTLACGTGCGSITTVLTLLGLVSGREVSVSMPGGLLSVTLSSEGGVRDIFLTGPTCLVFEGEVSGELLEEA